MPYEALLVDLDGVLRRWETVDASVEHAYGLPARAIGSIAFLPELLHPAITGEISDEAWRAKIALRLAAMHPPACDARAAVERWSESPGELDREVLALIERCRPGLRRVLVTNATSRLARDLDALGLSGRFNVIVNSSEVRSAKPAEAIFRIALQQAGVAADRALYIDDSATNVVAAARLGITGHRFTGHLELGSFLQRMGVLADAQPEPKQNRA